MEQPMTNGQETTQHADSAPDTLMEFVALGRYVARRGSGAPLDGLLTNLPRLFSRLHKHLLIVDLTAFVSLATPFLCDALHQSADLADWWLLAGHRCDDGLVDATIGLRDIACLFALGTDIPDRIELVSLTDAVCRALLAPPAATMD